MIYHYLFCSTEHPFPAPHCVIQLSHQSNPDPFHPATPQRTHLKVYSILRFTINLEQISDKPKNKSSHYFENIWATYRFTQSGCQTLVDVDADCCERPRYLNQEVQYSQLIWFSSLVTVTSNQTLHLCWDVSDPLLFKLSSR